MISLVIDIAGKMFITDKYSDCRTLMDSGTEPALKRF